MDISLYELALGVERSVKPLLIRPATLLSLVESVIDLLIEQQIAAKLWIKLPPGAIWQAEIERYHKQVGISHTIYTCNFYTNNPKEVASGFASSQFVKGGFETHPESTVVPVQLAPTSQSQRREYFLLVLSPQFCNLTLAYRPRPRQDLETLSATSLQTKAQRLLAVSSCEGQVIQRVLDGIKQAILPRRTRGATRNSHITAKDESTSDLLANWDSLFNCPPASDPLLLSRLLTKQIQRQEQISHRSSTNRAVTALKVQNEELINTLRLKDELLRTACAEIRTPLTHMKTALSLLNSPQLKLSQRQRYLQMLSTECDRQNSLISGLLELLQLDRIAAGTAWQPVRLSEIVPGVVSTYQPLAQEKGIMLAYTVPAELPTVLCPGTWLKQIVINLLHNSIKFTATGGQVWVRSSLRGDYVQLEFRDTGIGIPSSEIPKIFERFYRVRPIASEDSSGAGLGLTIVQQILQRCGGSISVRSRIGEGSTFNVLLPISQTAQKSSSSD